MMESGVLIEAFANTDENTPVAMTTTDASGNYSLVITTNGTSRSSFCHASMTSRPV